MLMVGIGGALNITVFKKVLSCEIVTMCLQEFMLPNCARLRLSTYQLMSFKESLGNRECNTDPKILETKA